MKNSRKYRELLVLNISVKKLIRPRLIIGKNALIPAANYLEAENKNLKNNTQIQFLKLKYDRLKQLIDEVEEYVKNQLSNDQDAVDEVNFIAILDDCIQIESHALLLNTFLTVKYNTV